MSLDEYIVKLEDESKRLRFLHNGAGMPMSDYFVGITMTLDRVIRDLKTEISDERS